MQRTLQQAQLYAAKTICYGSRQLNNGPLSKAGVVLSRGLRTMELEDCPLRVGEGPVTGQITGRVLRDDALREPSLFRSAMA